MTVFLAKLGSLYTRGVVKEERSITIPIRVVVNGHYLEAEVMKFGEEVREGGAAV
jgi:hypothetical protein